MRSSGGREKRGAWVPALEDRVAIKKSVGGKIPGGRDRECLSPYGEMGSNSSLLFMKAIVNWMKRVFRRQHAVKQRHPVMVQTELPLL